MSQVGWDAGTMCSGKWWTVQCSFSLGLGIVTAWLGRVNLSSRIFCPVLTIWILSRLILWCNSIYLLIKSKHRKTALHENPLTATWIMFSEESCCVSNTCSMHDAYSAAHDLFHAYMWNKIISTVVDVPTEVILPKIISKLEKVAIIAMYCHLRPPDTIAFPT